MLALAAANVVGAVLFAVLYASAGVRPMATGAFLACLAVIFGLVTTLWLRVEGRHRELGLVRRTGRAAGGLALVCVALPPLVLMPAFWLDDQLPPDAAFRPLLGPIMTVVLIALALTVAVNVVGAGLALARGLARRPPGAP